jgi:cytidylate kinase
MTVIAMTREMGSGSREVAQRVAEELGLKLILHELVEHEIAEHLHVPDSTIEHRIEGGATLGERLQVGSKRLAQYTTEEVLELASRGDVLIRGWGACVALRDVPHVLRVRICTPMEVRERAIMERRGITDRAAARREILRNDTTHERTMRAAFGVEEDPLLYDLVLNTERCSIEACVKILCDVARRAEFQETAASRAILNDKALEAHIRIRLRERFTVGMGVTGADVNASGGRIVLTGTAIHSDLVADASKLASEVPGVKQVVNRMHVVHGPRPLG